MVSSINSNNSALLNYLTAQGQDATSTGTGAGAQAAALLTKAQGQAQAKADPLSAAALQRAAGSARNSAAVHGLDSSQKTLATDLRAALAKAGVKLGGAVEFSVSSSGAVEVKGSDADKAAVQGFLKADTHQPSFASRIATQAQDALKLSSTIQQSAAISQAAKLSKSSGGVISLYTSLMQQAGTTHVVFSLSATSSALTFPGSLAANA